MATAHKLPIKRKTPAGPAPNPTQTHLDDQVDDDDSKPQPPFKFHRIWTENDELRFLQGLLDSAADGLVFPRDLSLFYQRFSQSTPQPYTKSQLSEKLRRLRRKFRALSARLSRGLRSSLLTPHDRALFHLSKQLWHPSFAASSPFTAKADFRARVRVRAAGTGAGTVTGAGDSSSPPPPHPEISRPPSCSPPDNPGNLECDQDFEMAPVKEEGAEEEEEEEEDQGQGQGQGQGQENEMAPHGVEIDRAAGKAVMDVFDQSLEEVRTALIRRGLICREENETASRDLDKRWREQRVVELDVLARRLRLVLDNAVHK